MRGRQPPTAAASCRSVASAFTLASRAGSIAQVICGARSVRACSDQLAEPAAAAEARGQRLAWAPWQALCQGWLSSGLSISGQTQEIFVRAGMESAYGPFLAGT